MTARWPQRALALAADPWAIACLALVTFQLVQASLVNVSADFLDSYWLGTYDEGFTRRGLGGELTRLVTGDDISRSVASAMQWVGTAVLCGLIAYLVIGLLRRSHSSARWLAVVLCAAPFGFDFLLTQRRPDQLSFAVFVGFALYLARSRRARPVVGSLIGGLLLGATMFIHEGGALIALPWMIVAIVVSRSRETAAGSDPAPWYVPVIALLAPVVVVGAIVTAAGPLSPEQEVNLRVAAVEEAGLTDTGALAYLDQSLTDGVDFVVSKLPEILPGSILLVSVVALLVAYVLRPIWIGCPLGRRETWLIGVVLAASFGFLFVTGMDWIRWSCWFGLGGAVVLAVLMPLRRAQEDAGPSVGAQDAEVTLPGRGSPLERAGLVVAATYLAALAPLPAAVSVWEAVDILFMIERRAGL